MPKALVETLEQVEAIADFYQNTKALIVKESYKLIGGKQNTLDIVRDVLRVAKILWIATQVVRPVVLERDFCN